VPSSSVAEVAEDLKAIFKVRRQKTARALAEEFVSLYKKSYPKGSLPAGDRSRGYAVSGSRSAPG